MTRGCMVVGRYPDGWYAVCRGCGHYWPGFLSWAQAMQIVHYHLAMARQYAQAGLISELSLPAQPRARRRLCPLKLVK